MNAPAPPGGPVHSLSTTRVSLADGRWLVYYDEASGAERDIPDRRRLPRVSTRSELRHDALLDEWVVVASHRQNRTHLPPEEACPLCPSGPGRPTEIPASDYDVVVFENRFPSLVERPEPSDAAPGCEVRPGIGRCEVVCFAADHSASLAGLPDRRVRTVIDVLADRTEALATTPGVEHVFPFENRGVEVGVTLHHPHGQIYAYPFVPPTVARMVGAARRYRDATGRCVLCERIDAEVAEGRRVLGRAEGWVAFVPCAARWPFEVHVCPTRHVPDLAALAAEERAALVPVLKDVLRRFDGLFPLPMPYMATWIQAPVHDAGDLLHLHLRVFTNRRSTDRLKYLASSESGAGAFVNDVPPERAADLLRAAGGEPGT